MHGHEYKTACSSFGDFFFSFFIQPSSVVLIKLWISPRLSRHQHSALAYLASERRRRRRENRWLRGTSLLEEDEGEMQEKMKLHQAAQDHRLSGNFRLVKHGFICSLKLRAHLGQHACRPYMNGSHLEAWAWLIHLLIHLTIVCLLKARRAYIPSYKIKAILHLTRTFIKTNHGFPGRFSHVKNILLCYFLYIFVVFPTKLFSSILLWIKRIFLD